MASIERGRGPGSVLVRLLGLVIALIGVAAGAFGAHALKARLAPDLLAIFEVSVRYQLVHALALLAVAWTCTQIGRAHV